MTRRKRRVFTPEFKAEAVGLVLDRGQTVAAAEGFGYPSHQPQLLGEASES